MQIVRGRAKRSNAANLVPKNGGGIATGRQDKHELSAVVVNRA